MRRVIRMTMAVAGMLALTGVSAQAAQCGNDAAGFPNWLAQFKQEAVANGISPNVVNSALGNVSYNPQVIKLDRNQKSFKLSLDRFMQLRAPASTISLGKQMMQQNAKLLNSLEQRYGVQKEVLVAIWGMETAFGRNSGNMSSLRSLATLAYDCRRSDFFTKELYAALQIVQRGDMSPGQLKGAWAGEIGQTQFLATNYLKLAVDGDGNGRRDLIGSKADALASTANYLRAYGWRAGAGYQPGEPNFPVLKKWNSAGVYQQALALFASKLAG